MLRLALTPRWLAAALVLLLVVTVGVLLGRWQWDRTQSILAAERAAVSEPIPVQAVLAGVEGPATELPDEGIGRPVTATGAYALDRQVAVRDRVHQGTTGVWIVTGLRLEDGSTVAVLRGSLPSATSPGALPPQGQVTVTGVLQPDETFYADAVVRSGTVASISHDRLAETWGTSVRPGFVVLQSQEPAVAPAPTPVLPTVQTADVPFPLQNFFYAFQWWIFGAFAVAVYGRWLWLDAHREPEVTASPSTSLRSS